MLDCERICRVITSFVTQFLPQVSLLFLLAFSEIFVDVDIYIINKVKQVKPEVPGKCSAASHPMDTIISN